MRHHVRWPLLLSIVMLVPSLSYPVQTSRLKENPEQQDGDVASERPRFSMSVDTVSLSITVLDKDDRLVTGLTQDNFKIYEDGTEQSVQFFAHESVPLRMVILLDTSSSMKQKLSMAQEAAVRFVNSLGTADQVQVVEFNDRVLTVQDFTEDLELASAAIRQTEVGGATSLYNAMYISLKDLNRLRRDELDRQAIIVLSDGADTRSLVSFEDVRELARKSNVIIYSISLRATEKDLKKQKYYNAKYELDVLAQETGGEAFAPAELGDLVGVYDEIAAQLKGQYSLGYISSNQEADGGWRHLQIVSAEPNLEIRTRSGYYAPKKSRRSRRPRD